MKATPRKRPSTAALLRRKSQAQARSLEKTPEYQSVYQTYSRRATAETRARGSIDDRIASWKDRYESWRSSPKVQRFVQPAAKASALAMRGLQTIMTGATTVFYQGRPYAPVPASALVNVVKLHTAYPEIPIPDPVDRDNLRFGNKAKLVVDRNGQRERIWVAIIKVGARSLGVKRRYIGKLRRPYPTVGLVSGQQVTFGPEHILDIA